MKRKELKLARYRAEMTQSDVANYLGVSTQRYGRIETGKGNPTLEQAKMLVKLLKIKIDIL